MDHQRIDLNACFTFYEFLGFIKNALSEKRLHATYRDDAGDAAVSGQVAPDAATQLEGRAITMQERIKMSLTSDLKFKVQISDTNYTSRVYVKMDRGMFRMLQFQSTPLTKLGLEYSYVTALHERRFHGYINSDRDAESILIDNFL